MIFARRGIEIDRYPAVKRHLEKYRKQLEPKPKDWKGSKWPGRKAGSYKWYELQDAVAYYEAFERPKITYQVIQYHPQYCLDSEGHYINDKCFILPTADLYLLAVLNSPLMWWHNWRYLPHMKDEALNPAGFRMEDLPIAPPTAEARAEAEPAVGRLLELTRERRDATTELLEWLRLEWHVAKPGQKLEAFAALEADAFLDEVRRRRPRAAGRPGPKDLSALRKAYDDYAPRIRALEREAAGLERRLAELVNRAYGLTPEDVELLWATAPPRMPGGR